MALPSSLRRNDYTGTALVNIYSYGFKIFVNTDLQVIIADDNGNEFPPLILGTDFSISGAANLTGGNITLINASQAWITTDGYLRTNYHLTILGNRLFQQSTSIRNQGTYFPSSLEDQYDKDNILLQQLKEILGRTLTFGKTFYASLPSLPSFLQASSFLMMSADLTKWQWINRADLMGATGPAGPTGSDGPAGPTGATGATGAAGANGTAIQESLAGTYNGGNTTYTSSQVPIAPAEVLAFLGTTVPQVQGTDYSILGKVITFTGQDTSAQQLFVMYRH